jgi:hypothetical protein
MRKITRKGIGKKSKTVRGSSKSLAWSWFSKYIRAKEAGASGLARCVTCGTPKHWKELQAGHWLPGRHASVLFDERNCHPQCYHCNVGLKGNPIKYYHFMEELYGKRIMDELESLDRQPKQLKTWELLEIAQKYKELYEELAENRG